MKKTITSRFINIDYVSFTSDIEQEKIADFVKTLNEPKITIPDDKTSIIELFTDFLTGFHHIEKNKYLNQRM